MLNNADRISGEKLKKLEWITYIGALENTDRSFENKLDRESGSGFSRAGRSDTDMHFLLISAADPIQISDRDIPTADHTYRRPVTAAFPESSSGASVATPPPTSCTTPTPPTPVLRVNKYKTLLKRERLRTFRLKRQVHHLQNAKNQKNLSPETLIQGAANFLEESSKLLKVF